VGLDLRTLLAGTGAAVSGGAGAPSASKPGPAPTTALNFRYEVDARGATAADLAGSLNVDLERSTFDAVRVYGGLARLTFGDGRLRVDTLDVESTALRLVALGALGLAPNVTDSVRFTAVVDSLGGLRPYLAVAPAEEDSAEAAPAAAPDSIAGSLRLWGTLSGSTDTTRASPGLALAVQGEGAGLVVGGMGAVAVAGTARVADILRAPLAAVDVVADSLALGPVVLDHAEGTFASDTLATTVADAPGAPRRNAGRFTLRAASAPVGSDSGLALSAAGRTAFTPSTTEVVLDSAALDIGAEARYRLVAPARLTMVDSNGVTSLDSLVLRGEGGASTGARVAAAGYLQDEGPVTAALVVERVPVHDVAHLTGVEVPGTGYDGRVGFSAQIGGTRAEPQMTLRANATDVRVAGVEIGRMAASGEYAARRLSTGLVLVAPSGRELLTARAALPLDLALLPVASRQLPDSGHAELRADSLDLALVGALVPGLQEVKGRLFARADVTGTWRRPRLEGAIGLDSAAATIPAAGIRLDAVRARVALAGDSVIIRQLVARSGGPADTASIRGWGTFSSLTQPDAMDLQLSLRNFLAIDRRRVATLWLSTPQPLTVTGPYLGATVRGAVRAERGRIYIPELIDKRVVDLNEYRDVVDTTVFRNRSLLPGAPSAFVENVVLQNVRVEVGDDVWLRSPEANIKLGGSLAVERAVDRTGARPQAQLALEGRLNVERGTYALDLLAARPIFQVEPGSLRFFGTPDLNPTLDIKAVHVVRQAGRNTNRPDVRVQVSIAGTLNQPTLKLESADNPPIPDTDLISYLVTGEPAAAVLGQGGGAGGTEQAVALGLRYASSVLSGALTGGRFDIVQVQTGGLDPNTVANVRESTQSILERTRLSFGGPLGERTFYTFSTGLCGLGSPTEAGNLALFASGLGFQIEHRITPTLSVQVGYEPGSNQQACGRSLTARVFQPAPSQGGIDFFRSWSF
jgi:translocation and assembly module TamB